MVFYFLFLFDIKMVVVFGEFVSGCCVFFLFDKVFGLVFGFCFDLICCFLVGLIVFYGFVIIEVLNVCEFFGSDSLVFLCQFLESYCFFCVFDIYMGNFLFNNWDLMNGMDMFYMLVILLGFRSLSRCWGYMCFQGIDFVVSVCVWESVLSFGSIVYFQYYFVWIGLLDGKGGWLVCKRDSKV